VRARAYIHDLMTVLASRRSDMPLRLVLADDHVVVRQALSLLLTSAGFPVVGEASNGREAVILVRERAPDVAVLDVVMPLLNGLHERHPVDEPARRAAHARGGPGRHPGLRPEDT